MPNCQPEDPAPSHLLAPCLLVLFNAAQSSIVLKVFFDHPHLQEEGCHKHS